MSTPVAATNTTFNAVSSASAATPATANDAGAADRFLKLLVTQLQNQDPMNPMDNAQITSQMAQINTVSGIAKLNTTVEGLNGHFVQLQALQGASLVGHDITLPGNRVAFDGNTGLGGFDLGGTADRVKVEILSPAGQVVQTIDMGAEGAGRHGFSFDATSLPEGDYRFRVSANTGTVAVATEPLMRDHVLAVSTIGSQLVLETRNSGYVAYSDVKAFN